ncbi:type 1 fimbrial protein [Salmonella enterica]|nr:type 1 fimbrial protein [Salmonella enterica subsp. enterica serovar Sandiego]EIQ4400445.1 type 1 fimbrial protein [Salmonella enterica]
MMKKILGSAALMVVLLGSSNVWATDSAAGKGVLTFTGSVSSGTCVVNGKDVVEVVGDILASSTGTGWDVVKTYPLTISITGCPASIKEVGVTPTFTEVTGRSAYGSIKNAGTAKNLMVQIAKTDAGDKYVDFLPKDQRQVVSLTGGAGEFFYRASLMGTNSGKATAGTLDYSAQFAIDFK